MATRLLTRADVAATMTPPDYLDAVERGFIALGEGRAGAPDPLHLPLADGGFHAKGAWLRVGERCVVAVKCNANLPQNPARHGLPTIQGLIVLVDGDDGRPLAALDSIEITLGRTAAASALAARHLARADAAVLAICGCGAQAAPHLRTLRAVLPRLREVRLWDRDPAQARRLLQALAADVQRDARLAIDTHASLQAATRGSDVIVTCTTSTAAFLTPDLVADGCFIAAVGADSPAKSEIAPALMARARVVVDSLAQCSVMGDLHHALAASTLAAADVHAELPDLLRGRRAARAEANEIWLFDSTGVGVQDVACALRAVERAEAAGRGAQIDFGR